jgi:hypothetical protein
MESDNHREIQYFGDSLAANYTWALFKQPLRAVEIL